MSDNVKRRLSPSEKILVNSTEGAALLSISRPTLYRLAQIEGFPVVRIGSRTLFKRRELAAWFDAHPEVLKE